MSELYVETDAVGRSAAGIRRVAEGLVEVRVSDLVSHLAAGVRGGAVETGEGSARASWNQTVQHALSDVELTAHAYEQSIALYEAIEVALVRKAKKLAADVWHALSATEAR